MNFEKWELLSGSPGSILLLLVSFILGMFLVTMLLSAEASLRRSQNVPKMKTNKPNISAFVNWPFETATSFSLLHAKDVHFVRLCLFVFFLFFNLF